MNTLAPRTNDSADKKKLTIEVEAAPVVAPHAPSVSAADAADEAKRKKRTRLQRVRDSLVEAKDMAEQIQLSGKPEHTMICKAIDGVEHLITSGYDPGKATRVKKTIGQGTQVWLKPDLALVITKSKGDAWAGALEVVSSDEELFFVRIPGTDGSGDMYRRRDISIRNPRKA